MPRTDAAAAPAPAGSLMRSYLLLAFTMACWGGNAVAGRLAVGQVSPMVITSLRWGIVTVALAAITWRRLLLVRSELRRDWRRIVLMAVCGFSIFNALFYVAAYHTTAVNISILQGSIPILVVIGALLLHRTTVGAVQVIGILVTLIGVAVVATHGHLATLAGFRLNIGDGLMLAACVLYAGYTLALRYRAKIPGLLFFTAMAMIAFLTSLPLLAWEVVTGTVQWPTPSGWAIVAFIVLFPSFTAQLTFMRGVQLIGPSRAGLFANLVPLFGAFFAVVILGEPLEGFHLVALILVLAGIVTAEAGGRSSRADRAGIGWPRPSAE
jgi:drug/metabolite transporter (DMT)-like permease